MRLSAALSSYFELAAEMAARLTAGSLPLHNSRALP